MGIANTASALSSVLLNCTPSSTLSPKAWAVQAMKITWRWLVKDGSKSNKTHALDPATGIEVPLFHPRRDDWHEHFAWSPDHLYLIGLTPTGRATIRRTGVEPRGRHESSEVTAA